MSPIPPTHPDDLEVATRALAGDSSHRALFAERMRCVPRMLAVMNRRQRHPLPWEDVEDLVQDTLVTIWRRLDTYQGMASLETWAYRFCRFQLANRMRAAARRPTHVDIATDTAVSEDVLELLEFEDVHLALDSLDALTATILRLKHFEGLSFEEIAGRLDLPANTAKSRHYRGLARMRGILGVQAPRRAPERGVPESGVANGEDGP